MLFAKFLVLDEDVRDRFLDTPIDERSAAVRELLKKGVRTTKVIARPLAPSGMKFVDEATRSYIRAKGMDQISS
ncbi:hypothetical protein [Sinorhizobium fredii]|nr:hypothetical protein [Sinorhizobium fredii]WOS67115.1 hypothetical protein SFGR64A_30465 [Sinorhizobium fredii GR64]